MPRGEKSKYTGKQERKADHIAEGYERKGGSGRGKSTGHPASKRGGRLGGKASASRSPAAKSRSAKKAAATRKRSEG